MVWVWTEWSKSLWQIPVELIYIKRAFSWDCVRITALPQNIPIKQVCIKIWIFDWLKICTVRYSCSNKEEICIQFGDNWQSDSKYVRRDTEKLSVRSTQRRDCGKWPDIKKSPNDWLGSSKTTQYQKTIANVPDTTDIGSNLKFESQPGSRELPKPSNWQFYHSSLLTVCPSQSNPDLLGIQPKKGPFPISNQSSLNIFPTRFM